VSALLPVVVQGHLFRQNMTFVNSASDVKDVWINELRVGEVSGVSLGISQRIFKVTSPRMSSCKVSIVVRF
jgi:hypothetical protein